MRFNNREFGIKKEATGGTAEAIAAADLRVLIRDDANPNVDAELVDKNQVQPTSSKRPIVTGRQMFEIPASYILEGPGDQATEPLISPFLNSALFEEVAAKKVTCGAVTGTFRPGETFTQAVSLATGMILTQATGSPGQLDYIPLTSTVDATNVITSDDTGATVTSTGAPADNGWAYRPRDDDFSTNNSLHTVKLFQDGIFWTGRGCLSDLIVTFRSGHPVIMAHSFRGAFEDQGDVALIGKTNYGELATASPLFVAASLRIGAFTAPTDLVDLTLNVNNGIRIRQDAMLASGVKHADYNKDRPTVATSVGMVKAATFDFVQTYIDGTVFSLEFKAGTVAGKKWNFAFGQSQIANSLTQEDDENFAKQPLEFMCSGDNNNEALLWVS